MMQRFLFIQFFYCFISRGYGSIQPSSSMDSLEWVLCHGGAVPPTAVYAGVDKDGGHLFVGRAFHAGDLLPAKVAPNLGKAYVSYAGCEIVKYEYEVLCGSQTAWKYGRGGEVPPDAIRIGQTSMGEELFMGRTMLDGTLTPGKVYPSQGYLFVPYDGEERKYKEYEVLVLS